MIWTCHRRPEELAVLELGVEWKKRKVGRFGAKSSVVNDQKGVRQARLIGTFMDLLHSSFADKLPSHCY
jgi:hypothetical protein